MVELAKALSEVDKGHLWRLVMPAVFPSALSCGEDQLMKMKGGTVAQR